MVFPREDGVSQGGWCFLGRMEFSRKGAFRGDVFPGRMVFYREDSGFLGGCLFQEHGAFKGGCLSREDVFSREACVFQGGWYFPGRASFPGRRVSPYASVSNFMLLLL